jgi:hypothetical protein
MLHGNTTVRCGEEAPEGFRTTLPSKHLYEIVSRFAINMEPYTVRLEGQYCAADLGVGRFTQVRDIWAGKDIGKLENRCIATVTAWC